MNLLEDEAKRLRVNSSKKQRKPLSGKGRRAKGQRGEREFFSKLSDWLGEEVRRSMSSAREGGADNEASGLLDPWAIEVKRQDTPSMGKWWQQTIDQANGVGGIPALAYRLPFQQWRVRVPMATLDVDLELKGPLAMDLDWTIDISLEAFAYLVRERIR